MIPYLCSNVSWSYRESLRLPICLLIKTQVKSNPNTYIGTTQCLYDIELRFPGTPPILFDMSSTMRMAWLPLSCFLFCFVLFLFYTGTSPILAMVADEETFLSCPTVHAFPIQQILEGVEWGKYLIFLLSTFPVYCCRQNIKPEHVMFLPGNSTMANKEKLLQAMKNVAVLNTPTPLCGSTCKHLIGFQDSLSISWR